jgi:hypothetical protein
VNGWPYLLVAAAAAAGAFMFGWPAWSAHRAREGRDTNAERYLAWRGRADRAPATGMTSAEQRRLWTAAGLLLTAVMAVFVALAQS